MFPELHWTARQSGAVQFYHEQQSEHAVLQQAAGVREEDMIVSL
jgi:hypothetical protein